MSQQPGAHAVSADNDHLEVTIPKRVEHKQPTSILDFFITEIFMQQTTYSSP